MHADAIIAIAASKDSQALTAGDLRRRDRLAAWKRPGFELGLWLEKFCRENPQAKGVVLESHGLFTWGDDARGLLRDDARRHQPRHRLARASDRRASRPSAARGTGRCRRPSGGAVAARADAGDPRHGLEGRAARSATSTTRPAVLEFVNAARHARRWRRSAPPAPTTSCAPRSARWSSTSTRPRPTSTRRSPASPAAVEAYRADYAAYYERCKRAGQPGDARPERGRLPGARRRHDHLRHGQGDGAHLGRVLRQRHQRDARRLGGRRVPRACPSRRPSTSSTGCSRRRSCSACRSRRASPAASRSSPAAPAASARRPPSAPRARAPASCSPTSTRARSPRPRADLAARHSADVVRTRRDGRDRRGRGRRAPSPTTAVEFGGLDILVSNAGIASSAPIEDDDARRSGTATWTILVDRLLPGLARGVPAAEGAGHRRRRSSSSPRRTASPPRPNAAAYCTAKAAEIHLARCLALEGAPRRHPRQRRQPGRRAARLEDLVRRVAASSAPRTYKTDKEELEEMYRQRSLLKRSVCPRTSPRPSISSPPTPRRSRPATSSTSTPATSSPSPAEDAAMPEIDPTRSRRQRRGARRCAATTPRSASSLARRGIDIDGDQGQGRRLRRRRPVLGRRHRRHALRPLPRPRRAARHLRQARRLRRHPPADRRDARPSRCTSPGTSADPAALRDKAADARPRLRRDELEHLPGRARPAALLQVRLALATPTPRSAPQAVEHNLECIEIGQAHRLEGADRLDRRRLELPRPVALHPRLRALPRRACARSTPRCPTTGGSSPSTRCTSRPSIRRWCRTGAPTT